MKKMLIILFLLISSSLYASQMIDIISETVATASTTATQVSIPNDGYLEISTRGKLYVSLTGVTTNLTTNYTPLATNTRLDTEAYFVTSDSIGVASDSGTVTYNMTIYRLRAW